MALVKRQHRVVELKNGVIGVISDTHGWVRPQALNALADAALIIHAGDIGKAEVLTSLETVAPVLAIRGNNDLGPWAEGLPDVLDLQIGAIGVNVIHNVQDLQIAPFAKGIRLVISGHSHMPALRLADGIHYLNPGSAGPRRFKLPIALARVSLNQERFDTEIIKLTI